MKFFIASDHAGFELKSRVIEMLHQMGHEVEDLGPQDSNRVDYPDFANLLCENVLKNDKNFGILICGSGIGMSIAANRHKGIRAALCHEPYSAALSRAHNDANVLCLGARVVGDGLVEWILKSFCDGVFEGGRHSARVEKL
ncbi:ribose 5-phosphate isomerase B [Helicobacter sp. MIT 05-5294]|uniref:ribose 5-phosphate isomerase B n=1 Tax=Helicobacter sp. MIT 05-5294 TaxID=1548150 RepID=UPI00051FA000|nr:ribose 5-phosphate isomerase B [Helicobacter sp. MIT 05-5294]TLD88638.1 ribose 5-phosphate isomerase B [Helicobacter sp. MIT 05-5294]